MSITQVMALAGIQAAGAGGLIGAAFESLLVGGGGGAGTNFYHSYRDVGGGGGAEVVSQTGQTIAGPYTIQVGEAGQGDTDSTGATRRGSDGGRTTFNGGTAKAGGCGFSHAATNLPWFLSSHTYNPTVQGGGGGVSNSRASITGETYAGSTSSHFSTSPSDTGGGAGGAATNENTPGVGVSSSITGSSVEYGKGGDGLHSTPSTFGSGGGASGTTNTIGRNGASGVLYVRLSGVSVDQATINSQLSSASNMTTTVSAVGSDTLIEFKPTTSTTVATVTWTP